MGRPPRDTYHRTCTRHFLHLTGHHRATTKNTHHNFVGVTSSSSSSDPNQVVVSVTFYVFPICVHLTLINGQQEEQLKLEKEVTREATVPGWQRSLLLSIINDSSSPTPLLKLDEGSSFSHAFLWPEALTFFNSLLLSLHPVVHPALASAAVVASIQRHFHPALSLVLAKV